MGRDREPPKTPATTQACGKGCMPDVCAGLEHQHEVEGAGDAEGHAIREANLTEGVGSGDKPRQAATGAL